MAAMSRRSPFLGRSPPERTHHPTLHRDRPYCAWRDAGMVILDVADRSAPKLITH